MPIIEIERKTGWNNLDRTGHLNPIIETISSQIPDTDGVYETNLGTIAL